MCQRVPPFLMSGSKNEKSMDVL